MNRSITNVIRFIMDELLPPILRDNRVFMYPFFWFAFKGKNLPTYMDFKQLAYSMTEEEFNQAYEDLDSLGTRRPTDMNQISMDIALENIDPDAKTMLDVGCGRGYWLEVVKKNTDLKVTGCDVLEHVDIKDGTYVQGDMEKLPFKDNEFDVVFSSHTIEHVRDVDAATAELRRVAKKQVIVVTPKQRYNYYTLDMHLNFFPTESYLHKAVQVPRHKIVNAKGDWVYIGYMDKPSKK